jgi:preprotein translocase subunit SecD
MRSGRAVVVLLAVVVAISTSALTAAGAATANRAVAHLQLRPVLATLPPDTTPPGNADPSTLLAVASCDTRAVSSLGQAVSTTKATDAKSDACVVLPAEDGSDARYFLGKSALDASSVRSAKATFASGSGWSVVLRLTPKGAEAFDALSETQFHKQVAVVADGVVSAAPVIQPAQAVFSSFEGNVQVSMGSSARKTKQLAKSIAKWRRTG